MVLALYVLAGLMGAGGLAAIYSGSDIIVMERGWTMVIAGSVFAACGALLVGIATAVARLHGLESEFARLFDRLAPPQAPSFATSLDAAVQSEIARERTGVSPPIAPDIGGHKDVDIAPEPVLAKTAFAEPAAGPLPAEETRAAERAPAADGETSRKDEPAPDARADAAEAQPEEEPVPTVVGTYNSGGNYYVMYSDGSIAAETPAGKFRFDSLDELKDFIARGGDKAKAVP